jgi:hypothetical protein
VLGPLDQEIQASYKRHCFFTILGCGLRVLVVEAIRKFFFFFLTTIMRRSDLGIMVLRPLDQEIQANCKRHCFGFTMPEPVHGITAVAAAYLNVQRPRTFTYATRMQVVVDFHSSVDTN